MRALLVQKLVVHNFNNPIVEIIKATMSHVQPVMDLISACNSDLRSRGIYQWDNQYPNIEEVSNDQADGALYVAMSSGFNIGAVSLNAQQESAYQQVAWQFIEPSLVIHRLCVAPALQCRGIGASLLNFAERYAHTAGYASIRLDVYSGNSDTVNFYKKRGYRIAGEVFFPRRELPFVCMEKMNYKSSGTV